MPDFHFQIYGQRKCKLYSNVAGLLKREKNMVTGPPICPSGRKKRLLKMSITP